MKIIGQKRLINEIDILLKDMKNGKNYNLLFRAPSGYGKTSLAINIMYHLGLENGEYIVCRPDITIDEDKRTHILDEVHLVKEPEYLYQYMDSGKYVFILCTNESGFLKEPLRNRCIQYIFDNYSDDDMEEMTRLFLRDFFLPDSWIKLISSRSRNNPRECKILCERLSAIFRWSAPVYREDLENILDNILQIKSGGFNKLDEIYINFLKKVRRASLDTISSATGIDKQTILNEIEPFLLYKNIIRITSKGRVITDNFK